MVAKVRPKLEYRHGFWFISAPDGYLLKKATGDWLRKEERLSVCFELVRTEED